MEEQEDPVMCPVYYLVVKTVEDQTLAVLTSHALPTESQTSHATALRQVSQFLFKQYPLGDWIDLHRPDDLEYIGRVYPRAEME
jgi:hypothetical protein